MIKLLIFDLDGTLANTIEAIKHGLNLTMRHYGFPEHDYDSVRDMVGNGAKNLIRRACPEGTFSGENGEKLFAEIYQNYCDMYSVTYLDTKECYEGIPEALAELKRRGYLISILSNKQDPFVKALAEQLLPKGVVSFAQGQTELPIKPDPTVPLMICDKFGLTPCECAFIGDSDVDVKTAKNAGMFSVAVTWGYRDAEMLKKLSPDAMADTASQLVKIFA